MKATYQTRIADYAGVNRSAGDAALSACAELYGQVERKLFAEMAAGRSVALLKSTYLERYGMPARLFNAVRVSLQGKTVSVRKRQKLQVESLRRRISRAEKQIVQAEQRGRLEQVHHKRRRLAHLKHRLARLEADLAAGRLRLCFGSKRLWRKQYHLEVNGYGSHEDWLRDWHDARSSEFFVLGSRDETAGCQLCVADRRLAATAAAGCKGKRRCHRSRLRATDLGQAVSYRFKRDDKGWRVFADLEHVPVVTDGAIGVDLNADHLAVAETAGNYVHCRW